VVAAVDAFSPHQRQDRAVAGIIRQRWIFAVALGIILIGLGFALLQRVSVDNGAAALPSSPTREQSLKELIETTKGLLGHTAAGYRPVGGRSGPACGTEGRDEKAIRTDRNNHRALQQSIANTPTPAAKSR
jgi:hypothetical protein